MRTIIPQSLRLGNGTKNSPAFDGRGSLLPAPYLTEPIRRRVARIIARDLRAAARKLLGHAADLSCPETWRTVASEFGVATIGADSSYPLLCSGGLIWHPQKARWVILYNAVCGRLTQARALVHELAHWMQRAMDPGRLTGHTIIYWYPDDLENARHEIARRVEGLVFT